MSRASIGKPIITVLLSVMVAITFMPAVSQNAYAAAANPGKATIKTAAVDGNTVTLTWTKTKNAKTYQVYRVKGTYWKYLKKIKKSQIKKYKNASKYKLKKAGKKYKVYRKTPKYKKLTTTKELTYTYSGKYSTKYTFAVRAFNGKKAGNYSGLKTVTTEAEPSATPPAITKPGQVKNLKTEITTKDDGYVVIVTWDAAPDATEYEVYRRIENDVNGATEYSLRRTTTSCKYSTKATAGRTYSFKIVPKNSAGSGEYSEVSCTVPTESPIPEPGEINNLKVVLTENGEGAKYRYSMTATWDAAANTDSYDVVVTKNPGADAETYEYTTTNCSFTFSTNSYSTQFTFTITPKNSKSTGKASTVSCTTPEEVIEIERVGHRIYYYGETDPGNCNKLESTIKYDDQSLTYHSYGESVREGNSVYMLYSRPLVENNYFVLQPDIDTNHGVDHGVKCPVTWNVKENTIGAKTEVRGSNLVIKTPKYTSREQLRGKLIIELSSGEVKARELRFAPAFPEFIMGYEDLLEYDMTPDLRRVLTLMDLEQKYEDTNREIEELVRSITENCTTDRQKVGAIIDWFHNNIEYVMINDTGNSTVYATWAYKTAVCGGMAKLLAQMIRYADIPAGICEIPSLSHACTIFWLEGEWYTTDGTSYEKGSSLLNFSGEKYMGPITTGVSCGFTGFNITKGYLSSTGDLYHVNKFIDGTWVNNWDLIY